MNQITKRKKKKSNDLSLSYAAPQDTSLNLFQSEKKH